MKVIICGAGQVGMQIARHLAREQNDVVVVDYDGDLVRRTHAPRTPAEIVEWVRSQINAIFDDLLRLTVKHFMRARITQATARRILQYRIKEVFQIKRQFGHSNEKDT